MSSTEDSCPVHSQEELINNQYLSDVKFIVGEEKKAIFGHRVYIEPFSPVLYKMFKEKGTQAIEIKDIKPDVFLDMLKYMYLRKVSITNKNIVPLFQAADKYMVENLIKACLNSIDLQNVLKVMKINSETYNFLAIQNKCLDLILRNPFDVFEQEEFFSLDKSNLELILKQRYFDCCSNDDLLAALNTWKAKNEEIPVTDLESQILGYVEKRNLWCKLPIAGEPVDGFNYTSDTRINLMALKTVKLVGVGIIWRGQFKNLTLKITIDNNLVLEKLLDNQHKKCILRYNFKKISIEKKANVYISVKFNVTRSTCFLNKARMIGNSYFETKTHIGTTPIQYLIVEK